MKTSLVGVTVFFLFFGAATMDAVATGNWTRTIVWLIIGCLFLVLDNLRKPLRHGHHRR